MELSLELMNRGSYQVEMSDEGMMTEDIEECLQVVVKAVGKSDLPADDVIHGARKWSEKTAWGSFAIRSFGLFKADSARRVPRKASKAAVSSYSRARAVAALEVDCFPVISCFPVTENGV